MQQVGNRADVILVSVSDEQSLDFILVLLKVGKVRNYKVDAKHFVIRERHAAVHNDDFILIFIYGHVLADFAESAQRDYPEGRIFRGERRSAAAAAAAEGVFLLRIEVRLRLLFSGKLLLLRPALRQKLLLRLLFFLLLLGLLFLLRLLFCGLLPPQLLQSAPWTFYG